jgi:hypothetical protein
MTFLRRKERRDGFTPTLPERSERSFHGSAFYHVAHMTAFDLFQWRMDAADIVLSLIYISVGGSWDVALRYSQLM